MFLGVFGPNGLSMDYFNHPHLQSDLSVHASISKIWPTTGFRIARNRRNPIMLRSSIHSNRSSTRVDLNLRVCPESQIPSIQPSPQTPCMKMATKLSQKKIGGIVKKMTSDPLNGVFPASFIPASPCIVSFINLRLPLLLHGVLKDRPGCAVHYWEI